MLINTKYNLKLQLRCWFKCYWVPEYISLLVLHIEMMKGNELKTNSKDKISQMRILKLMCLCYVP